MECSVPMLSTAAQWYFQLTNLLNIYRNKSEWQHTSRSCKNEWTHLSVYFAAACGK